MGGRWRKQLRDGTGRGAEGGTVDGVGDAQAQKGLEELSHVEDQEGQR